MPEIKTAQKKKSPAEKLQELKAQAEAKKESGQKITVADLEERIKLIEELLVKKP
jgi:hypothetical protein